MSGCTRCLALIPARGGSKGLPGKNIRSFLGHPLIHWSVKAAKDSHICDPIWVSTDDPEIALVARQSGAEVPYMRPENLASDEASALAVALDALDRCETKPDWLLLLQPTSPLRNASDIRAACCLATDGVDAVVSVSPAKPVAFLQTVSSDGWMTPYSQEAALRRQDLPQPYLLNGALYLVRTDILRELQTFRPPRTKAYIMPYNRSVDIDTLDDFAMAEALAPR